MSVILFCIICIILSVSYCQHIYTVYSYTTGYDRSPAVRTEFLVFLIFYKRYCSIRSINYHTQKCLKIPNLNNKINTKLLTEKMEYFMESGQYQRKMNS